MSDTPPGSVSLAFDDSQIVPQLEAGRFPARLRFILHVVECCFSSHVTDNLIFRVFTELFLGIDDIWMWIGGDERRCSGLKLGDQSTRRCHLLPRLITWSLRHRSWNLHNHTVSHEVVFEHRRLNEASFRMRLCMVSWSIITSRVVQDARIELGFSDWRRWEHFSAINTFEESMEEALPEMESEIEAGFSFIGPEVVRAAKFEVEFGRSLQRDGHISHFQSRGNWNALQAFLYSEKTDNDWRMIHFSQHLDSECPRCLDLEETYPKTATSSHNQEPRLSLLIVRYIWLYFSGDPSYGWDDFCATYFASATRTRSGIPFISDLRLRKELKADAVKPRAPEILYDPWVNTLHPRWRDSATSLSLKERQGLEWNFHEMWGNPFLTNSLVNPERDAIDVAVWVTYILIQVYTFSKKPLSASAYSNFLSFFSRVIKLPFNESTLPGHLLSRAESFCAQTEASRHTCAVHNWKQFSLNERCLFAAAYFIAFPHSSSIPVDYSASQDFDDSCEGCLSEGQTTSQAESETHTDPAQSTATHWGETEDGDVEPVTSTIGSSGSITLTSSGDQSSSLDTTALQKQTTVPTQAGRPGISDLHRLLNTFPTDLGGVSSMARLVDSPNSKEDRLEVSGQPEYVNDHTLTRSSKPLKYTDGDVGVYVEGRLVSGGAPKLTAGAPACPPTFDNYGQFQQTVEMADPTASAATSGVETKVFACPLLSCGHMFKQMEDLKRHLRGHAMSQPFVCDKCGKKFSRSDNLGQHLRGHGHSEAQGDQTFASGNGEWTNLDWGDWINSDAEEGSGQEDNFPRATTANIASKTVVDRKLSKDYMLTELKEHFMMLLARYKIPVLYTNRDKPQLPWSTLPRILEEHALELVGWPSEVAPPDSPSRKFNPKGLVGLSAKEVKFLYAAMPNIDFRPSGAGAGRALVRPRDSDPQDAIDLPPAKKMKSSIANTGKMPLHKIQSFLFDIRAS